MAFLTSEVFSAVEVLAGRLVFGIVFIDHAAAVAAFFFGVPHAVKGDDNAGLPCFIAGVTDDPAADEVHDVCFKVWQCAFGEAITIGGHNNDFGALAEGVVDNFSANLVGVVIGDAGDFVIIFCIGATWLVVLRNDTRFGLSIRRQASGADPEGVVPYRLRYKPGSLVPSSVSFGIPYQLLPTVGQCFSALDEIWGGGATVSLDGGTNGEDVGAG